MAQAKKQSAKQITKQVVAKAKAPVQNTAPVETPTAPAETKKQRASRVAGGLKRIGDLAATRAHNKAVPLADSKSPVKAEIGATEKGANMGRQRVYGYDNTSGNWGVPKSNKVVVVKGATLPRGVSPEQWELLQKFAGQTVQHCYDNKVSSRTVRRAYRGGAIRFSA